MSFPDCKIGQIYESYFMKDPGTYLTDDVIRRLMSQRGAFEVVSDITFEPLELGREKVVAQCKYVGVE